MFTIKQKFPKDFEKYPEQCQSYYIHSIMHYGMYFEVEPIFWKLSESGQIGYISEILGTQASLQHKKNKQLYQKFEEEFQIQEDMERHISYFNNYRWNMNNQTIILNFYLDFTDKCNNNIIYDTIHQFIKLFDRNKNKNLPNEIWYTIFQYMTYQDILTFRLDMKSVKSIKN